MIFSPASPCSSSFISTLTFFRVTFDRILFFSARIFTEVQVLPSSQSHTLYLCSIVNLFKESLSLQGKAFLRRILPYASRGWFSFLSVVKLQHCCQTACRAITGYLLTFPFCLLFEASLPSLLVTLWSLSHIALCS